MFTIFPVLAAVSASFGWASGIILAQSPARALGAFEFTRVQLIACAALMSAIAAVLELWPRVDQIDVAAYTVSVIGGILLGNLAMIECLRQAGPRLTELLLCLKAPIVALMAYSWLGETLALSDMFGVAVIVGGIVLAIQAGHPEEARQICSPKRLWRIVLLGSLAAACQGGGFLAVKPMLEQGAEPIAVSAIRLAGAAALISLIGLWPFKVAQPQTDATPYLVFRTILPGIIGYGVSSSLLLYAFANMEAGVAAVLGSLSPLFVLPILWRTTRMRPNPLAALGAFLEVVGTGVIVLT